MKKEIKRHALLLRPILDTMPCIIALADETVRIEMINRKGAGLTGRKPETIEGRLCGDVFNCINAFGGNGCGQNPNCPQCPLRTRVLSTFQTGLPLTEEEGQITLMLDGKQTDLNLVISTARMDISGTQRVILAFLDITRTKHLEAQIRQSQKMEAIGTLAGGIAHDLNNILFPIVGISEMLMEDLSPHTPEHENIQAIHVAGNRGVELVKQILAFSRRNENKIIPVHIQQVLKEVIRLCRSTIPSHIEIRHSLQQACGPVNADPTRLYQIAMNLITNAYHAVGNRGGKITIKLEEVPSAGVGLKSSSLLQEAYAVMSVSDNGCGIPLSIRDQIFEPYFTTKGRGKGTGIGLSVVHDIIREYKGEIKVYSEEGKGTTFEVYLPLVKKDRDSEPPSFKQSLQTGTERILLIDDEIPVVLLEKQMLERLGYIVTEKTDALDALSSFKDDPAGFDLIITDESMPCMTGDQLAKNILSIRPDIPIIICSGYSKRIDENSAGKIGIKGFLMKPVTLSDMAGMVRRVLDEKKDSPCFYSH